MTFAVIAAVLAGVIGWVATDLGFGIFTPPLQDDPGRTGAMARGITRGRLYSTATGSAALAAALGLGLGIAGGLARRDFAAGVRAALIGLVVGGALGVALALGLVPLHQRLYHPDSEDLLVPMGIHAGLAAAAGIAGGLALAMGLGGRDRVVRSVIAGLLGAVLGAAVYELGGAMAFPLSGTANPLALTSGARLFGCLAIAIGTVAGVAAAIPAPKPRNQPVTGPRA